eukprot:CAMPEP_0202922396 /NCGR_PEP_ID=MMETSP1392-20130828/77901_1 /ASSEMBLY_ACC=CAM_ASM_000868 /TAXON_ID=225041 /ORGANISM="Chlamydomonas chlamydogama, Strain SAG 11-48b" /LENGTH=153 /DNA_ID=CAMNT_0049616019 /DNA_START=527 /DNA_END=985 /DNA_ORIENTATION=-
MVVKLLRELSASWSQAHGSPDSGSQTSAAAHTAHGPAITLVGESFGGCLGLRVALSAPELLRELVLINSATCFNRSLNGLSSLISSTNLLGVFPQPAYAVAQAMLLPLLVDSQRVDDQNTALLRQMILMQQAPSLQAAAGSSSSSTAAPATAS